MTAAEASTLNVGDRVKHKDGMIGFVSKLTGTDVSPVVEVAWNDSYYGIYGSNHPWTIGDVNSISRVAAPVPVNPLAVHLRNALEMLHETGNGNPSVNAFVKRAAAALAEAEGKVSDR